MLRLVLIDKSNRVTWHLSLCHLPPVCKPASESPSAALWLLLTMAKAKKKRKKSAQKTETQMKTHINCAFVSINEQGPTHNSKTRKTLAQKMTFHTQTHTHLAHTHTWRTWQLFGSFYATLLVLLPFLPFVELKMSTWVASTVSVCTHQYKQTHSRTLMRAFLWQFLAAAFVLIVADLKSETNF